jgi:Toprim domain
MMAFNDPHHEAWVESARAISTLDAAQMLGFAPQKTTNAKERVGACLVCGGTDRFAIVTAGTKANVFHCRGCGIKGGDGVGLVMAVQNIDFIKACEILVGAPPKGSNLSETDKQAWRERQEALKIERAESEALRLKQAEIDAAQKRGWAKDMWARGAGWQKSTVEHYLRHRGVIPQSYTSNDVAGLAIDNLRCAKAMPYQFDGGVIGTSDVMLGQIQNARGEFIGVHRTWMSDFNDNCEVPKNGRPEWNHPENGRRLETKRMLGDKIGGAIRLVRGGVDLNTGKIKPPKDLYLGEGNETTLSVYMPFRLIKPELIDNAAFWSGLDLGNLSTIIFPTSVETVILLGDGDSDQEKTIQKLKKAADNALQQGKRVRIAFSPKTTDFNDILRGLREAA